MAVEHVDIIDSECHEPKGASSALINQVMVSDGAGSGSYKYQTAVLNVHLAEITGPYQTSAYVVSPIAGEIETIYAVIQDDHTAISAQISTSINNVLVDDSEVLFSGNFEAGDVESATPTSNKTVAAGDGIQISSSGDAISANITIVIRGNAA